MSPALTASTPIPRRPASGHQLTHTFEELPLFWQYADKIAWRGGLISGQFEVSYDGPNDWWISDIWIAVDNGKIGAEAKGTLLNLKIEDDDRFYALMLDAIDHRYASYIEERIADEMPAAAILSLVA